MRELGDKINSTILAQSVNVSTVPWSGSDVMIDYSKEGKISDEAIRRSSVTNIQEVRDAVAKIG
jgi:biotin carboxylase